MHDILLRFEYKQSYNSSIALVRIAHTHNAIDAFNASASSLAVMCGLLGIREQTCFQGGNGNDRAA